MLKFCIVKSFFGFIWQPSLFEEIFSEAVTLVKETVLQTGIRESQLLDNDNAKKELSSKVQNLLISFVQVICYLF